MSDPTVGLQSAPDATSLRGEIVARIEDLLRTRGPENPLDYIWGGTSLVDGCDCSGFIVALAAELSIPLGLARPTANDDWHRLAHVELDQVQSGDLAFYGDADPSGSAHHVMVVVPGGEGGMLRVAGMSGGGRATTTHEIARKFDARLKDHPTHLYRPDFVGFRRLPFEAAAGVAA